MARTIPTSEPPFARAGDTWEWQKTLPDFPADTHTLTYTLFNAAGVETITATADGAVHVVDVAPATTAAYDPGRYDWIAQASDGADKYTVGKGAITVQPDLSAATTYDGRTHARKMLDAINAVLEGRGTNADLDLVRSVRGGRDSQREPEHLLKLRQHYANAVKAEDDAVAMANGQGTGRFIQTRFVG